MKILTESKVIPNEGYFWIINDSVVGITEEVPQYSYEYKQSKTHEETWPSIKPDNKSFDYYPRGRVMVDPEYKDNKFIGYTAMIFLDPCIDTDKCKQMVREYYNLDVPSMIHITYMGNLKLRAGINHYSCHNCRDKE